MERRQLLKTGLAMASATLGVSAIAKAQSICNPTPRQTSGPFYPIKDQLDKDADLTFVQGRGASAHGTVVVISGAVTDAACAPIAGALVEIWQACASGKYNHPSDPNTAPLDPNFQYWGKAITDGYGLYSFKTIIPGAYPAASDWVRPPHVHFKISKLGFHELITQMYFSGDSLNTQDKILQQLSPREQQSVVVEFKDVGLGPRRGEFNIRLRKV